MIGEGESGRRRERGREGDRERRRGGARGKGKEGSRKQIRSLPFECPYLVWASPSWHLVGPS